MTYITTKAGFLKDINAVNEEEQRQSTVCAGCHYSKGIGEIVCWACFKDGKLPYKYYQGTFTEWLNEKNN